MNVIDIPGYLDAVLQERLVRDAALFRLRENINGVECLPMTLRHYVALRIADSPLLPPFRVPTEMDMAIFLWVLSPAYIPDPNMRAKFMKRCRCFFEPPKPLFRTALGQKRWKLKTERHLRRFIATIKAAQEYVNEAMQDRPPMSAGGITGPNYYSDAVAVAADLCREFGWSLEYVLDLPLKLTFQLMKETRERRYAEAGQVPLMGNPSDRIKADWLREQNAQLTKN